MTYWCTADGPVGVEADEFGVYTPPSGATSGPYATEDEAYEACPAADDVLTCGDCEPLSVPAVFVVSVVNQVGDLVVPNSFLLDDPEAYTGCGETGVSRFFYNPRVDWVVGGALYHWVACWRCDGPGPNPRLIIGTPIGVSINITAVNSLETGWTDGTGFPLSGGAIFNYECELPRTHPTLVGNFTFEGRLTNGGPSESCTADVYITPTS